MNVGDQAQPRSFTASLVDVERRERIAEIPMPGRTRWAVYDAQRDVFLINIAEPARIVVVSGADPAQIAATYDVPAAGPHGLDLDPERGRLFCACDAARLVTLDAATGRVLQELDLSGAPDVVFFNRPLAHLYVAIGDPGVIDVFDTAAMRRIGSVPAEKGTHICPDFLPLLGACFSAFGRSSIFTDERYAARWHAKRAKAVIDAVAKSDTRTNLLRLRQYRPAMEWLMPEVKHGIAATLAQLDPP